MACYMATACRQVTVAWLTWLDYGLLYQYMATACRQVTVAWLTWLDYGLLYGHSMQAGDSGLADLA